MTTPTEIEALHERYSSAWARHDVEAIASMHAPDVVLHQHIGLEEVRGWDAVRDAVAEVFVRWPDLRGTPRRFYAGPDLWVLELTIRGTLATPFDLDGGRVEPTGDPVEFSAVDVVPVENGLVKRKDTYFDLATVLRQLGALRPDAFASRRDPGRGR